MSSDPRSPLGEPTPLPPAIEARLDEYRRSVATLQLIGGEYDRCETSHEAFQQAEVECDAARAALSTEIGKEIERYATLRRLLFEDMGSVEQMRTYAPTTFDALVDKFTADFAASRPPAPRTAQ